MAAGTKKTDAELQVQIDAGIKTNGNKEITPPIHNSIEQNIVTSKISKKDAGLVVDNLLGYSTILTPSDDKHFATKKYVDDSAAAGDKYLFGNATTDGSVRLHYNSGSDKIECQKRVSGTWIVGESFSFS